MMGVRGYIFSLHAFCQSLVQDFFSKAYPCAQLFSAILPCMNFAFCFAFLPYLLNLFTRALKGISQVYILIVRTSDKTSLVCLHLSPVSVAVLRLQE